MSRKPQQKGQATTADPEAGGGGSPYPEPPSHPDISGRGKIITKGLTEEEFSDSSGIPRSRLKALRSKFLEEGPDWVMDGVTCTFTKAGQDKLTAKLELDQVKAPQEERETLVVERFWTNPTLLGCRRQEGPHESGLETVRVRDTKNFIKGMEVPVKRQPGQRLWLLDGPHPRYRGRF